MVTLRRDFYTSFPPIPPVKMVSSFKKHPFLGKALLSAYSQCPLKKYFFCFLCGQLQAGKETKTSKKKKNAMDLRHE